MRTLGLLSLTLPLVSVRGFRPSHSASSGNRSSTTSTALLDGMTDLEPTAMPLIELEETSSTMDAAKKEALTRSSIFAVTTQRQTKGRGTRGRVWNSADGNLFMTIAIPLSSIRIPLNLCPLRIGTLVVPSIQNRINSTALLKWPNDILVDDMKICGMLIEVEGPYMFAGIGCNVQTAPDVPTEGAEAGRRPTCLADHLSADLSDAPSLARIAADIAREVCGVVARWLGAEDSAEQVLRDFEALMLTTEQQMRGEGGAGQRVLPLRLNADGTLQVRVVSTGEERALVADYLW